MSELFQGSYISLGLMSGTSLDGIDLCLSKFTFKNNSWNYEIIKTETIPYSKKWQNELANAINLDWAELLTLDYEYGHLLGNVIKEFLETTDIKPDILGSHGHTVHHKPDEGYTIQIGNGHQIALKTEIETVFDFRSLDVSKGGQGAPLVPIGDKLLFSNFDVCVNLGGFANLTKYDETGTIRAYDICALNTVLNYLASSIDLDYDENGHIAASGKKIPNLLTDLENLSYYSTTGPKSLGIEWVKSNIFPLIDNYLINHPLQDVIHTYTIHAAKAIAKELPSGGRCLFTGGGAFNDFLISRIKTYSDGNIEIPDNQLISFKEALIFGFLAVLKSRNEVNVLSSVTGSKENTSSGILVSKNELI
ncbi:anhydro-N-acetylmuramic acid kinase [Mangrovivirga sp. M17]|uniref:Anhydro-N-acetylmuramic acid kinase n=1 Tax=Mangrovivirga halotolerans TaxID=2993936 RepID=A0ABT3RT59_9BACT|nr:anhydro-N-acetylmuramic acid kinase [Mangrovivirga halotolerans]MCX2744681.1 anhydro-N-acetylmuramic acid kinase [Mangrovivirga halotolerans]